MSLEVAGSYKSAINMWWVDFGALPMPHVPVVMPAVERFMEHHFSTPRTLPMDLLIGVVDHAECQQGIQTLKLRQLTSPELLFAFLLSVERDLGKSDENTNAAWRAAMRSTPAEFTVCTNVNDWHLRAFQFREDVSANHAGMRMSAVQKMFDVKATMDRLAETTGKATVEGVAAHYTVLRWAQGSDVITNQFVESSLTVLKRLMSLPRGAELVMELEQYGLDNPMDSIIKYQKLVQKAATPEYILWSLELLVDQWKSGLLPREKLTVRHLAATFPRSDGKGIVDTLCMKKDILTFLTGPWLEEVLFSDQQKKNIQSVCVDIKTFREKHGYPRWLSGGEQAKNTPPPVNLQWKTALTKPEERRPHHACWDSVLRVGGLPPHHCSSTLPARPLVPPWNAAVPRAHPRTPVPPPTHPPTPERRSCWVWWRAWCSARTWMPPSTQGCARGGMLAGSARRHQCWNHWRGSQRASRSCSNLTSMLSASYHLLPASTKPSTTPMMWSWLTTRLLRRSCARSNRQPPKQETTGRV